MALSFRISKRIVGLYQSNILIGDYIDEYIKTYDEKRDVFYPHRLPPYKLKKLYDSGVAIYENGVITIPREDIFLSSKEDIEYKPNDEPNGFMYIAYDDREWYKIGYSTMDVASKEKCMKTYNPYIRIIYTAFGGSKTELELHRKFADKRKYGEWFALTEDDIQWIKDNYRIYRTSI